MAQNWTSWLGDSVRKLGGVFRIVSQGCSAGYEDADARRMHVELDAIRARFQDHR